MAKYSVAINGIKSFFDGQDAFRNSMRTDINASIDKTTGLSQNHVKWTDEETGEVITETFVGQRTSGSNN